jgi:hypothetical protein
LARKNHRYNPLQTRNSYLVTFISS